MKRLLTRQQRLLLKYQREKVITQATESQSESEFEHVYKFSDKKKDLLKFEQEMTGFNPSSMFERNLLFGIWSNRSIQCEKRLDHSRQESMPDESKDQTRYDGTHDLDGTLNEKETNRVIAKIKT